MVRSPLFVIGPVPSTLWSLGSGSQEVARASRISRPSSTDDTGPGKQELIPGQQRHVWLYTASVYANAGVQLSSFPAPESILVFKGKNLFKQDKYGPILV